MGDLGKARSLGQQLDFLLFGEHSFPSCRGYPLMCAYVPSVEKQMQKFYATLSARDKRRYAASEAWKLGSGGIRYIAQLLGCSAKTVSRGIRELEGLPEGSGYDKRARRAGGGRKPYPEVFHAIDAQFLEVLKDHTAGDPTNQEVRWTDLTPREISERLSERSGRNVSLTVIRKLLKKHNYRRRKAQKSKAMKEVAHRDEQFENIARIKAEYEASDNPILSMDTKKKEYLGEYYRPGQLYTQEAIQTYDHDFNSFADGVVIPHGIYDLKQNRGYITLGTSKDTSEFACDSVRSWWYTQGQYQYPKASSILILGDSGGSNHCRQYLFKEDLQKLADELGKELRIAHYPPYASKYNPIDHRLFPHVTRACQGVVFRMIELVKELMEKTKTKSGLGVMVQIIDKVYQTGRKVADDFKEHLTIVFDQLTLL